MSVNPQLIVEKYHDIIAEEVNVKKVSLLWWDQQVTVQYVPLGNTLWAQFGKDTGRIIGSAKQWKAKIQDDGSLLVEDGSDSWMLSSDQYELRYSGFDGPNQIVEDGAMIELDLTLTDELIAEWVAREISRFLNQMRKDADYDVSDRIQVGYQTDHAPYAALIVAHQEYLQTEALVASFVADQIESDHSATFELDGHEVMFYVKR